MKTSREIHNLIQRKALDGAKVPHGISCPVIHREDGNYYFAWFLFFYDADSIRTGFINAPEMYLIADLKTGELLKECPYAVDKLHNNRYDIRMENPSKIDDKKIFTCLDFVRSQILKTGQPDMEIYHKYMDEVLKYTPLDYQRFYQDLSI